MGVANASYTAALSRSFVLGIFTVSEIFLASGPGYAAVCGGRSPSPLPRPELPVLQRDTFSFETALAYDGGEDGCDVLRRVLRDGVHWLRRGGALLLELGGSQADLLRDDLAALGYHDVRVMRDEDGDVRGVEATLR